MFQTEMVTNRQTVYSYKQKNFPRKGPINGETEYTCNIMNRAPTYLRISGLPILALAVLAGKQ